MDIFCLARVRLLSMLQRPLLSAIVALSQNRVIGINNQLPWRLPADLQRFKAITMGHPIVMGRKTFASIGRPLPGRLNIIVTRNETFATPPGCLVLHDLAWLGHYDQPFFANTDEVFIIGGAELYAASLPFLDRLYLTVVQKEFAGDAYFPAFDWGHWEELACESHPADEANPHPFQFVTLARKAR
jgi:dihydrofolate reductase